MKETTRNFLTDLKKVTLQAVRETPKMYFEPLFHPVKFTKEVSQGTKSMFHSSSK